MCLKEKPMGLLDGKTAIVTGGGTGIGLAIARRFHGEGAKVVICGRRMEKLLESSQRISSRGEGVYAVKADVTVEDDLKRIVEETVKFTGRIDILVNNAGIILSFGKMEEVDPSLWDTVLKTNARAPWRLMVAVLPEMRKVGGGSIINMSFPGHGIYGTSKAALIEVSQVMAMELASDNIRVNVICPAHVEGTELHIATVGKENIKKRSELMAPLHPLGRNGKPEDIANAALFLASDQSSWLTGIVVNADGGRSLETNRTPSVFSVSKIPS
jgi:NAD(P)-dependent dehydrogenase (short-subunit alcohol dehydrogenase family)